jgi:adenylylsulfate kinase
LWSTGVSGAGKTTLARTVADELARRGRRVEILDGDEMRVQFNERLGFSKQDRDANVARIGSVARPRPATASSPSLRRSRRTW